MEERDLIIGINIGSETLQISAQRGLVEGISIENLEIKELSAASLAKQIREALKEQGLEDFEKETRMMVLTADETDGEIADIYEKFKDEEFKYVPDIRLINEREALFHYVINQPTELKGFEVLVIDFTSEELKIRRAITQKGRAPIPVSVEDEDAEGLVKPGEAMTEEQRERALAVLDESLAKLCEKIFEEHVVTGIYLLGSLFEAGWYVSTRDVLCKRRRVFVGSNLYSRGACLYASDKVFDREKADAYLYFSDEILKFNIGVKVRRDGAEVSEFLIEGGNAWRHEKAVFNFIPEHDMSLPIVIRPVLGEIKDRIVPLPLPKEKDRDPKSIRYKCELTFDSDTELRVVVEDIGMGEFYPATGKRYQEVISL